MSHSEENCVENVTVTVPLKYLGNFWWSFEILVVYCKVEFKLKWQEHWLLSKLFSKGFERSVFYKTKSENKNNTNNYRYFLESNFIGVNIFFVLIYSDEDSNAKS